MKKLKINVELFLKYRINVKNLLMTFQVKILDERVILPTELLFGFIKAFFPACTFVRLREHDGYILDTGSANKVDRYNVSHVAIAIDLEI